jgi:hypothetical protein
MANGSERTWLWFNKADEPIHGRGVAMVHLFAEHSNPAIQHREWLDCRIETPWSGRRTEKEARLAALRQIRTLVVREIQELEGRKQLP